MAVGGKGYGSLLLCDSCVLSTGSQFTPSPLLTVKQLEIAFKGV